MKRHIDQEIKELKDQILTMGEHVEKAINASILALTERNEARFQEVFAAEDVVNEAHIAVDESCIRMLATQAPLAADLRLVVAILKISTDLERMGDQAVNIAHNGKDYISQPPLKPLVDIPKMSAEVRQMVRQALDAFVKNDAELARAVLAMDDSVDEAKNRIFTELKEYMTKDPTSVGRALDLILIARNLERLGDHATNIAEDVIYISTGKDIRHGHR